MHITEEYKGIKAWETSCSWHMRPSWKGRYSASSYLFVGKKYIGNTLQREKYSMPYKVKSSGSVYCTLINMGVK